MTWTGTDEAGNKTVGKSRIVDRDTHEWTVVTTDPQEGGIGYFRQEYPAQGMSIAEPAACSIRRGMTASRGP